VTVIERSTPRRRQGSSLVKRGQVLKGTSPRLLSYLVSLAASGWKAEEYDAILAVEPFRTRFLFTISDAYRNGIRINARPGRIAWIRRWQRWAALRRE